MKGRETKVARAKIYSLVGLVEIDLPEWSWENVIDVMIEKLIEKHGSDAVDPETRSMLQHILFPGNTRLEKASPEAEQLDSIIDMSRVEEIDSDSQSDDGQSVFSNAESSSTRTSQSFNNPVYWLIQSFCDLVLEDTEFDQICNAAISSGRTMKKLRSSLRVLLEECAMDMDKEVRNES